MSDLTATISKHESVRFSPNVAVGEKKVRYVRYDVYFVRWNGSSIGTLYSP